MPGERDRFDDPRRRLPEIESRNELLPRLAQTDDGEESLRDLQRRVDWAAIRDDQAWR